MSCCNRTNIGFNVLFWVSPLSSDLLTGICLFPIATCGLFLLTLSTPLSFPCGRATRGGVGGGVLHCLVLFRLKLCCGWERGGVGCARAGALMVEEARRTCCNYQKQICQTSLSKVAQSTDIVVYLLSKILVWLDFEVAARIRAFVRIISFMAEVQVRIEVLVGNWGYVLS